MADSQTKTAISVHRCRFVDYTPSSITALAFPPLPLPSPKGKDTAAAAQFPHFASLAVGHANGNIDLCYWSGEKDGLQSPQAWVVTRTLPGLYPSKVDSLAFSIRYPRQVLSDEVPNLDALRLFSSGGGSELLEWDTDRCCVRRTISSQGGSIWSISVNPASTQLAMGCEDGSIRILSLLEDDLVHLRKFDRVKSRLLSIAWGPPTLKRVSTGSGQTDDEEYEWSDSWLVTGGSDSSLRKWDAVTGRSSERMGTDKVRGERTLVWAVCALGDGTIVSGDSLGMVEFWDSRTCTQLQSFQGHGADVLCLAVSPEGSVVYSSGVDQKTTQYSLVKTHITDSTSTGRTTTRWIQSSSRRMHSHDIRALAMWPPYTPLPTSHKRSFPIDVAPVLASGGLDMSVVVTPAALPSSTVKKIINPLATSVEATFGDSYHRRLAYAAGPSNVSSICISRSARLVSCLREAGVSIWRINQRSEDDIDAGETASGDDAWEKVLEMDLNVHTNLVASAISDDGRWFVVSDLYETKLFSLATDPRGDLTPKRVRNFGSILQSQLPFTPHSTGGLAFAFTPDSSKLVMTTAMSSCVLLIDLGNDTDGPKVLRRFDHHRQRNGMGGDRVTKKLRPDGDVDMEAPESEAALDNDSSSCVAVNILRIAVSADGQWAATSDDNARTHVFNLDSIQHHCVLPSFAHPAQTLAFDPSTSSLLTLAFPDNSIQIYDVESRQFPSWSKGLIANLPQRFTQAHDPVLGATFDPGSRQSTPDSSPTKYALFWGSTWMCKINMDGSNLSNGGFNKKRLRAHNMKRPAAQDQHTTDFKMITHFRPILHADFISPGELVVVERPLVDVLATLPPAYFRHKYGAS
ncbi:WD40-repeat-containing domain protein [Desarmillaria tabescens]|uniref:WD40-repeat-containing domain protein n=1 Tax=Armillaria tabescens TaxID=1929756 RepID=A0AA39T549_ARMTA|nr:WD40-repeat-containing domain protein [Desarmillaria tabescens]KAK0465326.1 WD40-repeat-containing domain protein [Desarmillaria tabescens]